MRHLSGVVVVLVASLSVIAIASNVPRINADVATVKRFCTTSGAATPVVGIQCQNQVRILTGTKLSDGGTKATADGGAPITPNSVSELISFPGDTMPIHLGTGEKCVGVVSDDGGTNTCVFFDVTDP